MLKKYPTGLKLYNEVPYVREFLSKYTTADRLHQLYNDILKRYKCTEYRKAYREFVWDVVSFVLKTGGIEWYFEMCKKIFTKRKGYFLFIFCRT